MTELAPVWDHDDDLVGALTVPPRDKLIAFDLRGTLIHECGHLIVGDHVGVEKSFADIWLCEDAHPLDKKLIRGRASFFPRLHGRNKQLMGVAGIVAESLADEEYFCSYSLLDQVDNDPNTMSATDRERAGEIDEALLHECADILRQRWPDLIAEALHYLEQFEKSHADDGDVVGAAPSVRVDLERIASRFHS
ncbi:hypothetical protein [Hyphomicrobium nitrativorans]|uniref:hypothetical protein n=1 Tax=Hyphomicrobium nitrativorans TaxID=1427356 RepID=UPI0011822F57|nr:hypothetical protein [Hyphomicrobium nitrativorans]